eukprot:2349678-Pyramimonas_sp.AAC.1
MALVLGQDGRFTSRSFPRAYPPAVKDVARSSTRAPRETVLIHPHLQPLEYSGSDACGALSKLFGGEQVSA